MKTILFFFLVIIFVSCDKKGTNPSDETELIVANQNLKICVDTEIQLDVTHSDSSDQKLQWEIISGSGTISSHGYFEAPKEINLDSSITTIRVSLESNSDINREIEITILSNPYNTFEKVNNFSGRANSTIELDDGNFYTVGYKIYNNVKNFVIWKFDKKGKVLDERHLGKGEGHIIYKTSQGKILIGGTINSEAIVGQIDNYGNAIVENNLNGFRVETLYEQSDGSILAGGSELAKLSSDFLVLWKLDVEQAKDIKSIIEIDGEIAIVGEHYIENGFYYKRINQMGQLLKSEYYGPGDASSVVASNDGNLLVHGRLSYLYLMKIDTNGVILWQKDFFNNGNSFSGNVSKLTDGNYTISGKTSSDISNGGMDGYLIKVDQVGNVIWIRNYGGKQSDSFINSTQTADGGFLISGEINGKLALIKTDNNGNVLCPCECY